MRLYSSQAYEEMDFPPPLDTAPRSEAGSVSVEPSRNNESEVLAEPRGSFEAQMPLASNVAPDPQPQEGFLVDLAAVHSLPAAVAKKKRHAPVDDWDVEKPLIGEWKRFLDRSRIFCFLCARSVDFTTIAVFNGSNESLGIVLPYLNALAPSPAFSFRPLMYSVQIRCLKLCSKSMNESWPRVLPWARLVSWIEGSMQS